MTYPPGYFRRPLGEGLDEVEGRFCSMMRAEAAKEG
jgi:hypothetical protein